MLALQEHFSVCDSCEAERHSIRQVKLLLRSLHSPHPQADLHGRISVRLTEAEQPLWRVLVLTTPRPQRGRRLVTALAISCLTVLSFAASLAPASRDGALTTSGFLLPMGFLPAHSPLTNNANLVSWTTAPQNDLLIVTNDEMPHQARFYSGQYLSLPSSDLRLSAMPDTAEPRYLSTSTDFASYRSR